MLVPSDPTRTTVSVVLDANSLDTGNKQRDKDLRGADFFDVVRFPKLRFTSTRVDRKGEAAASIARTTPSKISVRGPGTAQGFPRVALFPRV